VGGFSPSEESRLVDALKELDKVGAKFLLSYKATERFVKTLPKSFKVQRIYVTRSVSGFARGRSRVAELFIRNYEKANDFSGARKSRDFEYSASRCPK
jgi:site-specific DNA-adenine methylase